MLAYCHPRIRHPPRMGHIRPNIPETPCIWVNIADYCLGQYTNDLTIETLIKALKQGITDVTVRDKPMKRENAMGQI